MDGGGIACPGIRGLRLRAGHRRRRRDSGTGDKSLAMVGRGKFSRFSNTDADPPIAAARPPEESHMKFISLPKALGLILALFRQDFAEQVCDK